MPVSILPSPARRCLAGCLSGLGMLLTAPAATAFELYSWNVAETFCELRSFGMERKQAITTAADLTFNRNPFMQVDFLLDAAVTIKEKETLAVARIRRQADRRCPKLARREEKEKEQEQEQASPQATTPQPIRKPGTTP